MRRFGQLLAILGVINNAFRRIRAVVANAAVWGGAWFLGVMGLTAIAGIFSSYGKGDWRESLELARQGAVLFSVVRYMSGENLLPLTKLLGTGLLGLIFGSIAAAGTLRLAQVADRILVKRSAGEVDLLDGAQAVPSMQGRTPADPFTLTTET